MLGWVKPGITPLEQVGRGLPSAPSVDVAPLVSLAGHALQGWCLEAQVTVSGSLCAEYTCGHLQG